MFSPFSKATNFFLSLSIIEISKNQNNEKKVWQKIKKILNAKEIEDFERWSYVVKYTSVINTISSGL